MRRNNANRGVPPSSAECIATLRLFNEKVERLDRSAFTRFSRDNSIGISLSVQSGGQGFLKVRTPDDDSTDAFALTLRFFIQNNESMSIGNVGALYEAMPIPKTLKDRYARLRDGLNRLLDSSAQFELEHRKVSNRHVLNVFLYGGLAHAADAKKAEFDRWQNDPVLFALAQLVFNRAAVAVYRFAVAAHLINSEAIAVLLGHHRQELPPI